MKFKFVLVLAFLFQSHLVWGQFSVKEYQKKKKEAQTQGEQETADKPLWAQPTPSGLAGKSSAKNEAPIVKQAPVVSEIVKQAPVVSEVQGSSNLEKIFLKSTDQCFVVEYQLPAGAEISCIEPLPIKYTERDCKTSEKKEIGKVHALVSCEKREYVNLKFRTSKNVVSANLKVRKVNRGRAGIKANYSVDSLQIEKPNFFDFMPKPEILPLDGATPEEAPIEFKYSGYVSLEQEKSEGFGFSSAGADPNQGNLNLLSNLNFELGKDRNRLTGILEVGEIFSGDDESGGRIGAGGHSKIEVRNLYLTHDFFEGLSLSGGRMTVNSEPRGFIFSDHIFALQLAYKSDLSEGIIWYGKAKSNRPANSAGAAEANFSDEYFGSYGTLGFLSRFKCTGFSLYRKYRLPAGTSDEATTDFNGDADLYWVGGTIDYDELSPLAFQGTYIFNWGHVGATNETVSSYLMDGRISTVLFNSSWSLNLEGLLTSAIQTAAQNHFYSTVAMPYLLTIFTSDGADDAPGSAKSAVVATMNDAEGLQLGIMSLTYTMSSKATLMWRAGYLQKAFEPSTSGQKIGQEYDFEFTYQLSPSSIFQFDFAYAVPGTGVATNFSDFKLAATKLKYTF